MAPGVGHGGNGDDDDEMRSSRVVSGCSCVASSVGRASCVPATSARPQHASTDAESVRNADERAQRQVHPGFDPLEILQRHAEPFGGFLLRQAERTADLGDPSPHALDDALRPLPLHGSNVVRVAPL